MGELLKWKNELVFGHVTMDNGVFNESFRLELHTFGVRVVFTERFRLWDVRVKIYKVINIIYSVRHGTSGQVFGSEGSET